MGCASAYSHISAESTSGGGVGGIALAVALNRYPDIDVSIYESAGSFEEVGAGVTIWGRGWRVLSLMGLDKPLRKLAGVPEDGSGGKNLTLISA